jgi:pyridoxine 5-phosphate synthase
MPLIRHPRLSVNVNKVATVRNSRGGTVPSVVDAARVCVSAGAAGITVHPRSDERHITRGDVLELAATFADDWGPALELNIEGDPRPDWVDLVCAVRPAQATLVPVTPGEVTSHAGWVPGQHHDVLEAAIARIRAASIRVSLFVDPVPDAIHWAKAMRADRVELYTEPYARAHRGGPSEATQSFDSYVGMAELAHSLGLGINAGHDLDLDNLVLSRALPHLDEVSIGHAIVSRAIFVGLDRVVKEYLSVLSPAPAGT